MRAIIKLLILLGLAVLAALYLKDNTGYVSLVTGDERRTVTLAGAIFILLVGFILFYFLFRLLAKLLNTPKTVRNWSAQRHENKDVLLLERGWIELLEGRNDKAQKEFVRLANHTTDTKRQLIANVSAARAAHDNGDFEKRDKYLLAAQTITDKEPRLNTVATTVQAELLLDQGKGQEALAYLEHVNNIDGNQTHIQRLMLRAYRQTGESTKVILMARVLAKKKQISTEELKSIVDYTASNYIAVAQFQQALALYQSLERDEKAYPNVALVMAGRFDQAGDYERAASTLEVALDETLDVRLLQQYAKCPAEAVSARLNKAQKWLVSYENNPDLLLTLGQLCLTSKLWGQAERYLNKSLSLRDDPKVHALLGILNDRQGRAQEAIRHWRLASASTVALSALEASVLDAADTSNDPSAPPDVKNLDTPRDHFLRNSLDPATIEESNPEEYFDSAPIPMTEERK